MGHSVARLISAFGHWGSIPLFQIVVADVLGRHPGLLHRQKEAKVLLSWQTTRSAGYVP